MKTITLFRPVGEQELTLIAQSDYSAFPPRLPEQPVFYPVLNEEYATQIARDWNAKHNSPKRGYVTQFQVREDFLTNYNAQTVGASIHREYWIPADELSKFNENIVGKIEIVSRFINE
jgi:hypothetical protein